MKRRNQTIELSRGLYYLVVLFLLLFIIVASVPTEETDMCKVATMLEFDRSLNQILLINRKWWPHHYFKISSNDVTGSFCGHSKGGRRTSWHGTRWRPRRLHKDPFRRVWHCGIETHLWTGAIYGHFANGVHFGSCGTHGQDCLRHSLHARGNYLEFRLS